MKRIFVIVVFIFFKISIVYCQNYDIFSNPEFGYSIEYPSDWIIEDFGSAVSFYSNEEYIDTAENGAAFGVLFMNYEEAGVDSIEGLKDLFISQLQNEVPEIKKITKYGRDTLVFWYNN